MSNNLLLDIGNSNIKAGISDLLDVKKTDSIEYSKNNLSEAVGKILKKINSPVDLIGIATTDKLFEKNLGNLFRKKKLKHLFISRKIKLPIRINYKSTLGADRIAGAAGASYYYLNNKNILFIDFGTATTINLVSDKIFLGGMIAPGILTSMKSLNEYTTLPKIKFSPHSKIINQDTKSNIQAGTYYQTLFFIEKTISELKRKYKSLLVISTGGFGKYFKERTDAIDIHDENLVLKGISIILRYHASI